MSYENWLPTVFYKVGDAVYYQGNVYNAIVDSLAAVPSTSPASWTVVVFGDITDVIAGTGLSGGGSSGAVTLNNAGVLSLDGATGALSTDCGQFHKNTTQSLTGLGGATSTVSFQDQTYTGTAITRNVSNPTTQFIVNTKGVYSLEAQIQLVNVNTATFNDATIRVFVNVQRGAQNNSVITNQFEITNGAPTNPALDIGGSYLLLVGDIIQIQVFYNVSAAGTLAIQGQSAAPNDYDLNTFWSYQLIKPLP